MADAPLGLRLLRRLLRTRLGPPRDLPDEPGWQPRRLLVVRVDERLGDLLLTTPLLRALAGSLPPGGGVEALVSARYAPALAGNPHVTAIHPFAKRDLFRRPGRYLALLRDLRARGFDAALDASHPQAFSRTSAALTYATGAPLRVGHARGAAGLFLNRTVPVRQPVDELPEHEHKATLLAALGLPGALTVLDPRMVYAPLERAGRERARARDLVTGLRGAAGQPVIALYPGGRKREQRWPAGRFATVGRDLGRDRDARVVVAWGPGEEALAREVAAEIPAAAIAPPTTVLELAALYEACDVVLTNDTGPMHLAVAVGTPTCAVFLTGAGQRYGPPGPRHRVVDGAGAAPAAGEVRRAVEALLERREGGPA